MIKIEFYFIALLCTIVGIGIFWSQPEAIKREGQSLQPYIAKERAYYLNDGTYCVIVGAGRSRMMSCDWSRDK